jgi:hypothetical protein
MERAGDILKNLLGSRTAALAGRYHSLFSRWDDLVGDPLAGSSRVIELDQGKLLVAVDHPAALQMLHFREKRLLRVLKRRFPDLDIRFMRVIVLPTSSRRWRADVHEGDPDRARSGQAEGGARDSRDLEDASGPPPRRAEDGDVDRGELSSELQRISDPRLRQSLRDLYRRALERERD